MKKQILLLFILLTVISTKQFGQGTWTFAAPTDGAGSAGAESARAICVDASGNTYIIGNFNGAGVATDFDLNSSSTNIFTATTPDGFIASYDKNGNFRWKTIVSGSGSDFNAPAGNICTNGTYVWIAGSANVSVGAPTIMSSTNTVTISSPGTGVDAFVGKLNCSNGGVQWAQGFGGTGSNDFAMGICVDPNGFCYVSGAYSSAFTLGSISAPAISGTISDVYIAKFNPSGTMIHFNSGGSTVQDIINAGSGLCYVPGATPAIVATGHTGAATAAFGTFTGLTNSGGFDAFLVELDTALASYNNALVFGSTGSDELLSAIYDPSSGGVFVSGFCSGNITFPGTPALTGLGAQDIVIARYSVATNNFVWSSIAGGAANDRGWCLAADGYGGIFLSGYSQGACSFSGSVSMPPNAGLNDLYVTRYTTSGTPVWVLTATGAGSEEARGIASYVETTPSYVQNIFVTGFTNTTGVSFGSTLVGCDGGNDFFLAKLTDASPPSLPLAATQSQVNLTCNGVCTGNATVVASGGTSPYTYSWAPSGGSGATASSLCAGSYTCTITDAASSSITKTFTLTQSSAITLNANSQTNISCNGGSNGAASVVAATGGTGSFTYNWTPGNPTGDGTVSVSGLTAQVYTCTATDANSCTANRTFNITAPSAISVTPASQTNISCFGGSNGAASINTPTGGAGGFTYNWTPGNPTGDGTTAVTGLTAGTWTCTVTDANSCTRTQTFNVTQPTAIVLTPASQTNISCNGGSNGAASVNTATGGAGGYTYNWTPGNPTGDGTTAVTGLTVGNWTCTVTDANSCTTSTSFNITQPTALALTPASQTNISCNGGSNGAASVNAATGGAGGYTYNWTPGNPTGDGTTTIAGLTAQVYTCTVTDANSCTTSTSFNITQPTALALTPASQTNISCNGGSNGAASVNAATGGAGGYTYNWTPGNPTGDGTTAVTGLTVGTWTCTVTDANSCTRTQTFNITQPTSALATSTTVINISCFGGLNGSATVTTSGGTSGYSYLWSTGATTSVIASQLLGTKSYTVTDANGCTSTGSVVISQPTQISASIGSNPTSCTGNTGSAAVTSPAGGVGGYTYSWAPIGGTANTATGLGVGNYTCTVSDANSCSITKTVSVITASGPSLTSLAQTNIACFGNSTGAASVNSATGGTSPYTYNWTPGNPTGDGTTSVTGLTAQVYTCTVTDANGCSAFQTFNITQPASALATSTTVTNVLCFGNSTGAATVTAIGGTSAYTYLWSTGATTSVIASQTSGVKTVTVTDANGCTSVKSVNITQPASALATSTAVTNVLCNGNTTGAATITVTGGTTSYSYLWSTGATTSVITSQASGTKSYTITDANGCNANGNVIISQPVSALVTATAVTNVLCNGNATGSATITATGGTTAYSYLWSTGATTSVITSQTSGVKTVTVTDANGCSNIKSVSISQPSSALATSTAVTNLACFGNSTGSATITATGGTASYTYLWSGAQTTSVITGQTAGVRTATVTDANGCTSVKSVSISQPAAALATSTTISNVLCNGGSTGSATVTATGGTSAYTYLWSTGATTSVITSQTTGVETVTVTDANGCSSINSVNISEPTLLTSTTSQTNTTCNGVCNGAANVSVSGGTSPFAYAWMPGGNTTASQNGLCAGSYTVTITDANGCALIQTITITEPTAVTVSAISGNILCNGGSTTVTVTANGGNGAFTGTGTFTQTAGSYTYTISDANACSTSTVISISEPTVLTVNLSAAPIACNGSTTQVNFVANGGTSPYTGTTPVTVSAGSYSYTVTDNNGCAVTETISISEPVAIVGTQTITLCNGQSLTIGANTYTASGIYVNVLPSQVNGCDSTLTTDLTISPAITHTQNISLCFGEVINVGANTYNTSGTYVDVLAAISGCDSTLTTVLVVNPAIDITTNLNGLTISANESTATYQWIDCDNANQPIAGETNQSFTASSNGNYAVILTQNSCSDTSACVNISTVGIKEVSKLLGVNIYPNPTHDGIFNISGLTSNTQIVIYDAIGQIVYSSVSDGTNESINLAALADGIYLVKVKFHEKEFNAKIIKN